MEWSAEEGERKEGRQDRTGQSFDASLLKGKHNREKDPIFVYIDWGSEEGDNEMGKR